MREVIVFGALAGLVIGVLVLIGISFGSDSDRLDRLENRMAYVYEVIQARRVSSEHCESYSDDGMICALNAKLSCTCARLPDQWDIANKEFDARVAAKAQELLAAQAEATSSEEPDE